MPSIHTDRQQHISRLGETRTALDDGLKKQGGTSAKPQGATTDRRVACFFFHIHAIEL
jgi:hypothetical protein